MGNQQITINVDSNTIKENQEVVDKVMNIIDQRNKMLSAFKALGKLCQENVIDVSTKEVVEILNNCLNDMSFQKEQRMNKGTWYIVKTVTYGDRWGEWSDYRPIFDDNGDVFLFETAEDAKKFIEQMKEINPKWSTLKLYIKDGKTNKLYKPNKIGTGFYKDV